MQVMLSEAIVCEVALAADMFLFPHVADACRQFLAADLGPKNAVATLLL